MDTELRAEDGHAFSAYAAGPRDAARGLVVVQEIFGVNRHMRRVCDDYAAQGYAVVCPALFDRAERGVELGYAPADVARGRELRGRIDPALTVLDIRTAAADEAMPPSSARRSPRSPAVTAPTGYTSINPTSRPRRYTCSTTTAVSATGSVLAIANTAV